MPPARNLSRLSEPNRLIEAPMNEVHPETGGAPHDAHQRPPIPGEASEDDNPTQPNTHNRLRANINIATLNMNGLTAPTQGLTAKGK